ncbi:MAG: hypothetical protein LBV12_10375 [Puniceicoccales bacterium]|jgi:hypothetical protein|nr:hypothetical protein [Puniceicoccales bacterium]
MANDDNAKRADNDPLKNAQSSNRDAVFTWAPDPWEEVVKLEYGGDRSFATTVQNMVFAAEPKEFPNIEKKLLKALGNKNCTLAAQDCLCRLIGVVGSEACLGVVEPLLVEEKTSHLARLALEPIPGAKVDDVLRVALPKLKGVIKAGLIGTIAVRQSDKSVAAELEKIKNDASEPEMVREAATNALNRIRS